MMQNTSIFYNSEIILEMQIIACIVILQIHGLFMKEGEEIEDEPNRPYIILYLTLHILSYLASYFRNYDVKLNGQPDINGVFTARRETFISNLETFIMCIVIGFTVKHLQDNGTETFHKEGLRSYFLVVDSVVTFFYKPYIYFGLVIKIDGEIRKNLYTLYHKQYELLQEEKMIELMKEVIVIENAVEDNLLKMLNNQMNSRLKKQLSMSIQK